MKHKAAINKAKHRLSTVIAALFFIPYSDHIYTNSSPSSHIIRITNPSSPKGGCTYPLEKKITCSKTLKQNVSQLLVPVDTFFFLNLYLTRLFCNISHQMFSMPQVLKASEQLFQITFNLSVTL